MVTFHCPARSIFTYRSSPRRALTCTHLESSGGNYHGVVRLRSGGSSSSSSSSDGGGGGGGGGGSSSSSSSSRGGGGG